MPLLPPDELRKLLRELDDVCRQAQELSKRIEAAMRERAVQNRTLPSLGSLERRRGIRKKKNR